MKIIIFAGAPASGKTSVIYHIIEQMLNESQQICIAKLDCLSSNEHQIYEKLNIPVVVGLSKDLCPDHYLAINLLEIYDWARDHNSDYLFIETAGLCNRCAPFLESALNLCVIDCVSSIKSPEKLGPMVSTADVIVVTKGDMISQAEREVFNYHIKSINNQAVIIEANGLNGLGCHRIRYLIVNSNDLTTLEGEKLVYSMPKAICSYCVGETRIGQQYQQGMISLIDFEHESI